MENLNPYVTNGHLMSPLSFFKERGGLVVESDSRARGRGFDTYLRRVCVLEQRHIYVSLSKDTFTLRKVLVIPRKRWLRPDRTEKLLIETLKHQHKSNKLSF